MFTLQHSILEALSETMDMIERGEKTSDIVSALDRDHSIPPTDGRQLVTFAYHLRDKLRAYDKSWSQPKDVRTSLLEGR